jgi:hypothetical protein
MIRDVDASGHTLGKAVPVPCLAAIRWMTAVASPRRWTEVPIRVGVRSAPPGENVTHADG